ncbi:MAG: arylsulfotransferase family protein, partial [Pseudomonadota bacterium]
DQPRHDWDAQMHGMALFPNGDIVFNFEGIGVVRIDRCGEILWSLPNYGHHSVFLDDEGDIWVSAARGSQDPKTGLPSINGPVYDEIILQLSPEGEVMREISILDSIYRSGREGLLLAKGRTANTHTEEQGMDLIHLNDVEVLDEAKAGSFPLFEAGDIMISLRNINAVLVLDGETEEVKWSITGPFVAQHDPDFLEDGTISIFDNHRFDGNWAGRPKRSRIVVVDPETSGFRVAYGDQEDQAFYTPRLGKHQYLPNGNILISESQGGRVFEVTPGGDVVWAYVNRWDEDEVAWIVEGLRYPVDFLIMEDAACN